jgi:hypothetical protein
MVWQRNRNKHSLTVDHRAAKAVAAMAGPVAGMAVRVAKVAQAAVARRSRRPAAREAAIFPQEESLQVLRREDGLCRL